MKKTILSALLITGLITAAPGAVFACGSCAQDSAPSKCSSCQEKAKTCKITKLKKKVKLLWAHQEQLKIADDQLTRIKDIKHKAIKELIQLKADKEIIMVDLQSAMRASQLNLGEVNTLIDAKYAALTKTAKTFAKALGDIQNVLTADQRAQWSAMLKAMGDSSCPNCGGTKFCPYTGKKLKES